MSSNTVEKVQTKDLKEYKAFFKEIKEKILTSQIKAALAVNHELINLYWEIGSKGLLLCKGKNKVVAEYALRDINKPIGISQYEAAIVESLPKEFKGSLPSIEALEQELEDKSL